MLLDNKTHGKVGDVIAKSIGKDARLSMLSSLFSIYGYGSLHKELEKVAAARILLPMGTDLGGVGAAFRVSGLVGTEVDRRFRNTLNIGQVARECAEWLDRKAEVRAVATPVPQNLFHVANSNRNAIAIHGSSPFTSSGLGFTPSPGYEMNTWFTTPMETNGLLAWFDSIWNNSEVVRDIKAMVISQKMMKDLMPKIMQISMEAMQ